MRLLVAALGAALGAVTPARAEPPSAVAFARLPMIQEVRISPDGRRLAISSEDGGHGTVGIATVDQQTLTAATLGEVKVRRLQWLNVDYLLAEVTYRQKVGARSLEAERVVAIAAKDGHVASTLLGDDTASANLVRQQIAGTFPGPPARVWMVGEAGRTGTALTTPELFKVNPADGRGEAVERGGRRTINWGFDDQGQISGRLDGGSNGELTLMIRSGAGAPWIPFWTSKDEDEARGYQGTSGSDRGAYISHYSPAGRQLVLKRFADGSESPMGPPRLEDPVRLVWDPYLIRLAGRGFGDDAITYEWYDSELASIHSDITRVFGGPDAFLADWSRDRSRFVILLNGPDTPPAWYLFDRTRREVSPIGDEYPELKGVRLGTTRWFTYQARDGLPIHAYLTLPPGAGDAARGLPLIVLPHDGPADRDRPSFSYLTQFFATRGYAVLRPQYRGSSGFGKAFQAAGDRQWGSGMQTDLLDGIASLARQHLVDPTRVCIVGEGFGGYAALAGAAFHPEAYACAISISGASNLKVVLAHSGSAFRGWAASLKKIPYRDPIYEAMSPALHARDVNAPILLVSVDQDPQAPPEQTQLMRDALAAAGKRFEDVVLKSPDHDISSSQTARTALLQALEMFLIKNLPVH